MKLFCAYVVEGTIRSETLAYLISNSRMGHLGKLGWSDALQVLKKLSKFFILKNISSGDSANFSTFSLIIPFKNNGPSSTLTVWGICLEFRHLRKLR